MGLFPTVPTNSSNDGENVENYLDRFPPGSKARATAERVITLVKRAHKVFRGIITQDTQMMDEGEAELKQVIRDMGVSDETDVSALGSIILSIGAITPPAVYGEDHNDWN